MPATKRSVKHPSLSVSDRGCREEESFLLKQPAQKRQPYNIFLFTIQTQIHTNTSIVLHKCASPQISVHSMTWLLQCCRCLSIPLADIVYTGRNQEKETSGLERGSVQGVVPVPGCALQREFQRLPCSPANKAMTADELWVLAFISTPEKHLSFHKLHRPSLAPGISFLQDMARYPLLNISRAIRDVTALRQVWLFSSRATAWLVKGEWSSAYFSAKPDRQAEVPSCGWVGRDPWCMAANLAPPATCNTIVWSEL